MAQVVLNHVAKVYDDKVKAVKDFSLEIEDKEFIILVGPSGCGKSTVLRMIAGLEEISDGEISIDGRVVNEVAAKDRDIAMVFQNYALYPHMTVYDNIAFALKMRGIERGEIERRVKRAAETLELSDLLQRKPRQLSGGQRQRVALGRAIVREPKVFLMDEPLSNLDAKLRVQMRVEINKLYQQLKTTIIYVTHDQTEAMTMGTRIVVMKDGLIQQVDTPVDLYNKPKNLFVARFIGMPPMNSFEGRLEQDDTGLFISLEPDKACDFAPEGEIRINLSEHYACEKVLGRLGEKIVVGVRPEHIYLSEETLEHQVVNVVGDFASNSIVVKSEVVEMLGAESYLYLKTPWGGSLTARVNAQVHEIKYDDLISISLDPQALHLFDPQSEESLIF